MKFISFSSKIQSVYFFLDLLMMAILLVNLMWIVFDWIYAFEHLKNFLLQNLPGLYDFYNPIHKNFFYYDLGFVAVYIIEILIRWLVAIKRRTYHHWFFYPFVHWYDVIGSIPVGSLRFLRIIRIISIMFRLQRLHMVDFSRTYMGQKVIKYINILTEEISDRVILNILTGIQEQFDQGNPIVGQINTKILQPNKGILTSWLSRRFQNAIDVNYTKYKEEIRKYINQRIKLAIEKNQKMATIGSIPVLGKRVTQNIETLVADLIFNVLNDSLQDVTSNTMNQFIDEITGIIVDSVLFDQEGKELDYRFSDTINQAIEIIKDHVRVQQWKLREEMKKE